MVGNGGRGEKMQKSAALCGPLTDSLSQGRAPGPHARLAAKGQECLGMCLVPRSGFVQAGCVFANENHDKERGK